MAKLPSYKRIYKSDYEPEMQSLVETLSDSINEGFDTLYGALNRRLNFRDNFAASVKEITLTVNSTGIPTSPVSFGVDVTGIIEGLQVIKAESLTVRAYPTSGILLSFTQNGSAITINHATGLPANIPFRLKVIAYGN